jgi:hypothetical protein
MLQRAVLARFCFTSMTWRLTPAAMLLAAALAMGSVQAQAETVEFVRIVPLGSELDFSLVGSNTTVVVLNAAEETLDVPACGSIPAQSFPAYNVVFVRPAEGAVATNAGPRADTLLIGTLHTLAPGTRLQNFVSDNRQCCLNEDFENVSCLASDARFAIWKTVVEVVQPKNSTPLLFTAKADVTDDALGVITSQQDEDGFADVVVTNKGEKPTFATLLTDELLEPAERIVDILQLDYDPETGLAVYGGFLEY